MIWSDFPVCNRNDNTTTTVSVCLWRAAPHWPLLSQVHKIFLKHCGKMHMHRNRETASHCEPLTICLPIFSTTESGADFTYSHLFLFWRVAWDATVHLFCCCILRSVWKAFLGEYRDWGEKTGTVANAVDRYTIVQSEWEDNRFRFCLTMRVLKCLAISAISWPKAKYALPTDRDGRTN